MALAEEKSVTIALIAHYKQGSHCSIFQENETCISLQFYPTD